MKEFLKIENISRHYVMGDITVRALDNVSFCVKQGEYISIMGASGSGKSTLMNIIGCLDVATNGDYYLDGVNIKNFSKNQYADIRNHKLGFVFQNFNLLSRTTALENVELPLFYDRRKEKKNIRKQAKHALELVGLQNRMGHVPNQLSGGQKQRVAIARALVNNPSILLADEPTGNLDSFTSVEIMKLFSDLNKQNITILIVTHEPEIADYTKRKIVLKDGHIITDQKVNKRREL